jgi:hypothetical protein
MAGGLPDPLELQSWEDAFSHPISTVRKLEQQLRGHAEENREKLRTLVGYVGRQKLVEEEADVFCAVSAIATFWPLQRGL